MAADMPAVMAEIFRHLEAGQLADAESLGRDALESAPDDINVLGILGAILLKRGEVDEAEALLTRTVDLEPAFPKPHEDLGVLYLERGEPEQALASFERALALAPQLEAARRGQVLALQQLGRHEEAAAARRAIADGSPAALALAEADAKRLAGEFAAADRICQEVLNREPENISALRLMAVIASDDGRVVVAEGLLRRLVRLQPDNAAALVDLGRFLGELGRYPEAVELLESVTRQGIGDAELHRVLGDMLAIVGRSGAALEAYETCLAEEPGDPAALNGRGHMQRILGQRDAALKSYQQSVERHPDAGEGWWSLASLHDYRVTNDEITVMRGLLDAGELSADSAVAIQFALARAAEQREDFDAAWQHYEHGNAGKRSLVSYDPVEVEVQHDKICASMSGELFRKSATPPPDAATPIFVVGMPRSGSTLVEQILASHSQVAGAGELPYVIMISKALGAGQPGGARYPEIVQEYNGEELTGLGLSYLHHVRSHLPDGVRYFTDKMPANFSHVGLIRLMLPQAKIIDARRHPLATCVANYRQLYARGKNQSYDLVELAEYYLQYARIMDHWDHVLPGAVLRVDYESVVHDLDTEVRRILDYCELSFEEACVSFHESSRPVNTASAEQVRQPIYDSAVDYWRNYEQHLDDVREILGPVLGSAG